MVSKYKKHYFIILFDYFHTFVYTWCFRDSKDIQLYHRCLCHTFIPTIMKLNCYIPQLTSAYFLMKFCLKKNFFKRSCFSKIASKCSVFTVIKSCYSTKTYCNLQLCSCVTKDSVLEDIVDVPKFKKRILKSISSQSR